MKPLGEVQQGVLRSLDSRGEWYAGCGWLWDTHSGTKRIMQALEKRGLVAHSKRRIGRGESDVWTITEAGREAAKAGKGKT